MSKISQPCRDEYREYLSLLTEAMSVTRAEAPKVAVDSQLQLDLFTEENFDKRLEKLQIQVEFLSGALDDLQPLFEEYTLAQQMEAYDRQASDGAAFLDWLVRTKRLTRTQKDHVTVARSRLRVQEAAQANRRGHVHFQEIYSVAEQLLSGLNADSELRLRVNPVWVRAGLVSPAFLEGQKPPADVLFYAIGRDIRTALLDERGVALVEELAAHPNCTLQEWAEVSSHGDIEELAETARQLVELGLAALN